MSSLHQMTFKRLKTDSYQTLKEEKNLEKVMDEELLEAIILLKYIS